MIKEIEIGRWGDFASLTATIDVDNKKVKSIKIVTTKKILMDRFGHLLFEGEENPFMKAVVVSEKEAGKWIYYITARKELEEIGMKLSKRKQFFEPSPEFLQMLRSKDIVSAINSIVPISP